MPLIGNTKQNKERSIREFYLSLANEKNPTWKIISQQMIVFIDLIDELFIETTIWGLTSHAHLNLQTKDEWDSPTFVSIYSNGSKEYNFEYTIPTEKAPWQYATVKGVARDLIEAKRYLLISMRESEGWMDNTELNSHLAKLS